MIARAVAVLCALGGVARADGSADSRAQQAGEDANLESNAPRSGTTISLSLGAGLVLGGAEPAIPPMGSTPGIPGVPSIGRGPSLSVRLGRVATRDTVITFEISGGTKLYTPAVTTMGPAPTDHADDYSLMAGALTYVAQSLWLRGAGGLTVYSANGAKPDPGLSGLAGIGVDIIRFHKLVLGLETWGVLSMVAHKGAVFDSGLCLGLTYY